jgi:hypothetical protein
MTGKAGEAKSGQATEANISQIASELGQMVSATVAPAAAAGTKMYYIKKSQAATGVKTEDGKDLLRADFSSPAGTKIVKIDYSCTGPQYSCGHTYACDQATCHHDQFEITNNTAIWWAKTDDGNENLYTFAVHYQ